MGRELRGCPAWWGLKRGRSWTSQFNSSLENEERRFRIMWPQNYPLRASARSFPTTLTYPLSYTSFLPCLSGDWSSCFNIPLTLFLLCSQVFVLPYPILCGPGGEGRSIAPEVGTCHLIKLHSKLNSSLLLFINASQKGSNYQLTHRCSQLVKGVMCFGKDVLMDTEWWV